MSTLDDDADIKWARKTILRAWVNQTCTATDCTCEADLLTLILLAQAAEAERIADDLIRFNESPGSWVHDRAAELRQKALRFSERAEQDLVK